jgi:hypothetical protein
MTMSALRIAGTLLVAAGSVALAGACSSFGDGAAPPGGEAGGGDGGDGGGATVDAPSSNPETSVPGACALAATPSDVAVTTSPPSNLQTNGEDLFWIEGGLSLMRASLADCTSSKLAKGNITSLAVDSHWVAWGDPDFHFLERGALANPPTSPPTAPTPSLILGGGTAFWLDPSIISACVMPCTSTTVATSIPSPKLLASNGLRFFFFATDADAGASGALFAQSVVLGADNFLLGPLATGQDPIALAVNDDRAFWINASGRLGGVPAGGGASIPLPEVVGARVLAADGAFVYVATATTIGKVAVTGGALVPLVTDEKDIRSLLVTDDAIVWATAGAIRRRLKN